MTHVLRATMLLSFLFFSLPPRKIREQKNRMKGARYYFESTMKKKSLLIYYQSQGMDNVQNG